MNSSNENKNSHEPLFAWPGWDHLRYALVVEAIVTVWFFVIYGGADLISQCHSWRVQVHLAIELKIPLVPAFVLVYNSMSTMFLIAPFILRTRESFAMLARIIAGETLVAGLFFLAMPVDLGYPPYGDLGYWHTMFHATDVINMTYNAVPSLHVAFAVTCSLIFSSRTSRWWCKAIFLLWGAAICLSTLLTHQHHLLDVLCGTILALLALRFGDNYSQCKTFAQEAGQASYI